MVSFSADTEAKIHQDMTKCRDAVRARDWPLLRTLVQGVAAKAKRAADIGKMAADQATESWRREAISAAGTRLENGMWKHIALRVSIQNSLFPNSHSADGDPG